MKSIGALLFMIGLLMVLFTADPPRVVITGDNILPLLAEEKSTGQVPTAAQWNSYFIAKQDVLGMTVPTGTGACGGGMTCSAITTGTTTIGSGSNGPFYVSGSK